MHIVWTTSIKYSSLVSISASNGTSFTYIFRIYGYQITQAMNSYMKIIVAPFQTYPKGPATKHQRKVEIQQ